MSSPSLTRNNSLMKELEKYVKHLIFKTAQIIIQSRQGGKTCTESQPNPKSQSWFSLAINDNTEITHEAKKVVSSAQVAGQGILSVPMCIEISLKTTEGDLLVLENWIISMKDGSDPVARPNTVYNQMGLLLKSILCVSRVLPAYKFARRQGPDTHVMCYRIFAGESSTDPLGSGQQTAQIGQVMTGFSTICVRAEYRTQMTITPCINLGCSDPNVSGSSSSQTSAQQANWVKSDHFISAENLDNAGIVRRNVNNPDYDRYGEGNTVTTSDESSEAMRIFAASPPDNFIHRRFSDHYSSNESLGVQKFRSSKLIFSILFFKSRFQTLFSVLQDRIPISRKRAQMFRIPTRSKLALLPLKNSALILSNQARQTMTFSTFSILNKTRKMK